MSVPWHGDFESKSKNICGISTKITHRMYHSSSSSARDFERKSSPLKNLEIKVKTLRNCSIQILNCEKRYGSNVLRRKLCLRSEASPPKFFIPEQKGKVVYKVPGDEGGAIPRPQNIFKMDICHFTTYFSPDQMHSVRLQFQ